MTLQLDLCHTLSVVLVIDNYLIHLRTIRERERRKNFPSSQPVVQSISKCRKSLNVSNTPLVLKARLVVILRAYSLKLMCWS